MSSKLLPEHKASSNWVHVGEELNGSDRSHQGSGDHGRLRVEAGAAIEIELHLRCWYYLRYNM